MPFKGVGLLFLNLFLQLLNKRREAEKPVKSRHKKTKEKFMKKVIFTMAVALMLSFTFASCGSKSSKDKDNEEEVVKDEGDEAVEAYKKLVEKVEKAQKDGDVEAALEIIKEVGELEEKYKDVKLTDAQTKEIEELMKRL